MLNENFRLESDTLRKEIHELVHEKNQLQLELSAARIQINYDKEMGKEQPKSKSNGVRFEDVPDAVDPDPGFTDELLQKIEDLTKEKAELVGALEEAKTNEITAKKQLESARQSALITSVEKQTKNRGQQTDSRGCEDCTSKSEIIQTLESQVHKLQSENSQYEQRLDEVTKSAAEAKASERLQHETQLDSLRSEIRQLQKRLEREAEQSHSELEQLRDELKSKQTELEAARQEYEVGMLRILLKMQFCFAMFKQSQSNIYFKSRNHHEMCSFRINSISKDSNIASSNEYAISLLKSKHSIIRKELM